MTAKLYTTLAASALLLSACARQEVAQAPRLAEPMDGAAQVCTVTPNELPVGQPASAQMQVRNDGGWCAVRIADKDGTPFSYPLMRQRPEHGMVAVNKVNNNSRIEYTPTAGYAGTDAFTVALVPKDRGNDVLVQVAVNVEADPNRPAVAPTPAPTQQPAARSGNRRSSTSRTRR